MKAALIAIGSLFALGGIHAIVAPKAWWALSGGTRMGGMSGLREFPKETALWYGTAAILIGIVLVVLGLKSRKASGETESASATDEQRQGEPQVSAQAPRSVDPRNPNRNAISAHEVEQAHKGSRLGDTPKRIVVFLFGALFAVFGIGAAVSHATWLAAGSGILALVFVSLSFWGSRKTVAAAHEFTDISTPPS